MNAFNKCLLIVSIALPIAVLGEDRPGDGDDGLQASRDVVVVKVGNGGGKEWKLTINTDGHEAKGVGADEGVKALESTLNSDHRLLVLYNGSVYTSAERTVVRRIFDHRTENGKNKKTCYVDSTTIGGKNQSVIAILFNDKNGSGAIVGDITVRSESETEKALKTLKKSCVYRVLLVSEGKQEDKWFTDVLAHEKMEIRLPLEEPVFNGMEIPTTGVSSGK